MLVASVSRACLLPPRARNAPAPALEEATVSASRLREQAQVDVPASIAVLSAGDAAVGAQQHFKKFWPGAESELGGGKSRARYFQMRGIGELEQYEGAPNPSVGFLIDDIDFSGVGMPATLSTSQQVEVLRGPQGTRYGANALAGPDQI